MHEKDVQWRQKNSVSFCVFVIAWTLFFRVFRVFCVFCGPLFIKVK